MALSAALSSFPSSEPIRSRSPARMGAPAFAQLTRTIQRERVATVDAAGMQPDEFRLHHKVVAA